MLKKEVKDLESTYHEERATMDAKMKQHEEVLTNKILNLEKTILSKKEHITQLKEKIESITTDFEKEKTSLTIELSSI
jgi:predicted RNase H-like nuclease (RuvC/YqgF family)